MITKTLSTRGQYKWHFLCLTFFLFLLPYAGIHARVYPFQDTTLSDGQRLDNLLSLMTLEEKIANFSSRPAGVPRLGVRGTRSMEGLHGLAHSGPANWAIKGEHEAPTTTFPQSIGLAHTWDTGLLKEIAAWEAFECRYLAQNPDYGAAGLIVRAPVVDLGRDVRWGRMEECYGEDAFLAAELGVAYIKGLQGGHPRYWKTAALMKHFLANSNENNRYINSSDFGERLFREYYSYPFYRGITEGGCKAYMAAYNKYNGIPCTVHPMLKEVTMQEWGLDGIICTDGGAFKRLVTSHQYYDNLVDAAEGCIDAGINMFLDDYQSYLEEAITTGLITEQEIDEVLKGTLRVMLKLGLLDNNPANPYEKIGIADTTKPWTMSKARQLARKATVKSIVLLKNEGGILPLVREKVNSVAVIGPSADLVVPDWYAGTPPYKVSILEGIQNYLGAGKVTFAASNKADSAVKAAKESDVAIVCIGNHPLCHGLEWGVSYVPSNGKEEIDREAISTEQEDLVKLVRANNPNTILVLVSSFPYAIPWSKEHVPAILHVSQSSQEMGNGMADILFGKESPAGRLVLTWPKSIDDLLPILEYDITKGKTYMYDPDEPLFPFGHGLSYTSFEYTGLQLDKQTIYPGDELSISFSLTNTGRYDSDEVVQVYANFTGSRVERPLLSLKGFQRVHVKKGETKKVTIPVKAEDLMYWDVKERSFVLEPGQVEFWIGAASDDIRLVGQVMANQ